MSLTIRSATPADLSLVLAFIRALADYEKLAHEVTACPNLALKGLMCIPPAVTAEEMTNSLHWKALAPAATMAGTLSAAGSYAPPKQPGKYKGSGVGPSPAYSFSAAVVEVDVDPKTGWIHVPKIWVAHDIAQARRGLLRGGRLLKWRHRPWRRRRRCRSRSAAAALSVATNATTLPDRLLRLHLNSSHSLSTLKTCCCCDRCHSKRRMVSITLFRTVPARCKRK